MKKKHKHTKTCTCTQPFTKKEFEKSYGPAPEWLWEVMKRNYQICLQGHLKKTKEIL